MAVRSRIAAMAIAFTDRAGKKTPANLAKATATAAIVPVWITSTRVQP
jgi:hypothetical protein